MRVSILLLLPALLVGCPRPTPRHRAGAQGLVAAERVHASSLRYGFSYPSGYDPEAYSLGHDGRGNYVNLFRLRNGRVVVVRVAGRPTALNEYGGDDLWLWDVTHKGPHPGGTAPVPTTLTRQIVRLGGAKGLQFQLRWHRRDAERRVRIEGGGSFLDLPLSSLLRARTRDAAAHGGRTPLPGYVRYQSGRFIEYFHEAELKRATATGGIARPRFVVAPFDPQQRPIRREHRLGTTGWVLVWQKAAVGADRFREVRAGTVRYPDLQPQAIYRAHRRAAVAIEVQTALTVRTGSGAVVTSDGLVLTNRHVVPRSAGDRCAVILWNRRRVRGRVVARHPTRDLALVRIPGHAGTYTPMTLHAGTPPVGAWVLYLGSPTGGQHLSLGRGMVSALRSGTSGPYLQVQAPVNPGHSGGPLLDMKGRQIGVIVSRLTRTASGRLVQNHSFAIPAGDALTFLRDHSRRQRRKASRPTL